MRMPCHHQINTFFNRCLESVRPMIHQHTEFVIGNFNSFKFLFHLAFGFTVVNPDNLQTSKIHRLIPEPSYLRLFKHLAGSIKARIPLVIARYKKYRRPDFI